MFESKYSKVLTIILVIVVLAIIGLIGFLGFQFYNNYIISKNTTDFVDNFQGEIEDTTEEEKKNETGETSSIFDELKDAETKTGSTTAKKKTYQGFGVVGTIEIPKINLKYPIIERVISKALDVSVAYLYGTGINQPGNSVIIGHNYRNGLFFSNLKKVDIGDKVYIADNAGNKLTYNIYNKFETTPEDTSFYQRDTGGVPEITLSTCTDDARQRTIVFAKAE